MISYRSGLLALSLVVTSALLPLVARAEGHVARGRSEFRARCGLCHGVRPGQNRMGPTLYGVFGRRNCMVHGFHYSAAACARRFVWDAATLDRFLRMPSHVLPGNKMAFPGVPSAADRADLIAYLATLH
jgi:cytochrome c